MEKFKKFNSIDILANEKVFENLNFGHTFYAFKTALFGVGTASLVLIIEFVCINYISKLSTTQKSSQYNQYKIETNCFENLSCC